MARHSLWGCNVCEGTALDMLSRKSVPFFGMCEGGSTWVNALTEGCFLAIDPFLDPRFPLFWGSPLSLFSYDLMRHFAGTVGNRMRWALQCAVAPGAAAQFFLPANMQCDMESREYAVKRASLAHVECVLSSVGRQVPTPCSLEAFIDWIHMPLGL